MAEDDTAARKAFGSCSADIVLREGFEHAVLGELGKCGQRTDAERQGREDKVFQVEILAGAVVVDGVEVAEHVEVSPVGEDIGKEPSDEDGGEEGRERHAEGGEDEGKTVDPAVLVEGGDNAQKYTQQQRKGECDHGKQSRLRKR